MAKQLVIHYENTKHRFVKDTKVELTLTGPPQPELTGSTIGKHIFDLSPLSVGNVFTLRIRIPAPKVLVDKGIPTLLDIKQIIEVVRMPQGFVSVVPHATTPGNRFVGGYHPRLSEAPTNSGANQIYQIDVDTAFLDVTKLAEETNPKFLEPYKAAKPVIATAAPHYDSRLVLMEYTGGKPALWVVNIPDSVKPDRKTIHTLLFFRPLGQAPQQYTFIDGPPPLLTPVAVNRYLLDPPSVGFAGSFYIIEKIGTTNNKKVTKVQACGFERQVAESKKPILFVTPVPHASVYGDSSSTKWAGLMSSLVNALWADDTIGKSVPTGLKAGKRVIAGFSRGASEAFTALANNRAAVDELYLFDPATFGPTQATALTAWLSLGGKRLRMIGGGMSHDAMIGFAAGKGPNVTIKPTAPDYWLTDKLYLAAINMTKFEASTVSTPKINSISGLSGLFLVGPASKGLGTALQGRSAGNVIVVSARDVPSVGADELGTETGAFVDCFNDGPCKTEMDKEFKKKKPPATTPVVPIDSAKDFDQLVAALVDRTKKLRHQWAVMGGEDSAGATDRRATFKGFLQLCIEAGDFP